MTNHEWTTAPLLQVTMISMVVTTLTGMIAMTETAEDLIVMMIVAGAMAHGMMTAVGEVIMVPGEMTAEDTSTGTMTVAALATNATTNMMMTVMAGQLLPETATEVM